MDCDTQNNFWHNLMSTKKKILYEAKEEMKNFSRVWISQLYEAVPAVNLYAGVKMNVKSGGGVGNG